jgi:single-strand DNA-binding protein
MCCATWSSGKTKSANDLRRRSEMAGLNKVMIIGNLGADPEMRYTADGTALTSFRVASSRNYSGPDGERKEETEWFSVVTWRKLAEQCSQFLQKGRKVYVEGRLQTRPGTPPGEALPHEVIADRVLFWTVSAACRCRSMMRSCRHPRRGARRYPFE